MPLKRLLSAFSRRLLFPVASTSMNSCPSEPLKIKSIFSSIPGLAYKISLTIFIVVPLPVTRQLGTGDFGNITQDMSANLLVSVLTSIENP